MHYKRKYFSDFFFKNTYQLFSSNYNHINNKHIQLIKTYFFYLFLIIFL